MVIAIAIAILVVVVTVLVIVVIGLAVVVAIAVVRVPRALGPKPSIFGVFSLGRALHGFPTKSVLRSHDIAASSTPISSLSPHPSIHTYSHSHSPCRSFTHSFATTQTDNDNDGFPQDGL
ncbi:hypothetical protein EDB83DRAFT_2520549 [Lactarius deliciosus]|nr:hypothetical protein EDB83DRAFT_2520549 [Lactarius deliciosus]